MVSRDSSHDAFNNQLAHHLDSVTDLVASGPERHFCNTTPPRGRLPHPELRTLDGTQALGCMQATVQSEITNRKKAKQKMTTVSVDRVCERRMVAGTKTAQGASLYVLSQERTHRVRVLQGPENYRKH